MARFPLSDDELEERVRTAIRRLWTTRDSQAAKQVVSGVRDTGTRGAATGGKHLDGFAHLLAEVAGLAGVAPEEIRYRKGVEVPGYYRPTKQWDVVILRRGRLCAAVELKSMAGSYGNNLNNRTEEALGSAVDVWAAFQKGTLGVHQPWLGYLFVIREEPGSTTPVRVGDTALTVDPVFADSSYVQRYSILCERMVRERVYTAATLLSSPQGEDGTYREPHPELGFSTFARSFYGHLIGCM